MTHSDSPLLSAFTRRAFLYCAASTAMAASSKPGHELQNETIRLELHAGPEGVYLARLALNREPGWPGKGFSDNLLPGAADTTLLRSGTAILVEGSGWHGSRMPDPSKAIAGPGWLRLEGIELGPAERPIAREEWSLELGTNGLRWRITRTFLEACHLTADRFPALVLSTQNGHGSYSEIPGFLDAEMLLDGIKGFPVNVSSQWYEVVSPRREQSIHFAPSNLNGKVGFTSGFFSYAKGCGRWHRLRRHAGRGERGPHGAG
jgi:hypothetical protein